MKTLSLCLFLLSLNGLRAETLINGTNLLASAVKFGINRYTFQANAGDSLTLTVAKQDSLTRWPEISLEAPNGAVVTSPSTPQNALLVTRAPVSGTYTAAVRNNTSSGAAFSYLLRLGSLPSSFVVPAGDDGGLLTNAVSNSGWLLEGDLDLWYFVTDPGDTIVLRAATSFALHMDLMTADGTLHSVGSATEGDALIRTRANRQGTNMVLIRAQDISKSGNYQLNLARIPDHSVPIPLLTNAVTNYPTLSKGGLNQWVIYACKSNLVSVRCERLSSTVWYPRIEIFSEDGSCVASNQSGSIVTTNYMPAQSGRYTVMVQSGILGGEGLYSLRATGISEDGIHLCKPIITSGTLEVDGIRGTPGGPFVLLTTTNLTDLQWEPVFSGFFDNKGAFEYRRPWEPDEFQRYFFLQMP